MANREAHRPGGGRRGDAATREAQEHRHDDGDHMRDAHDCRQEQRHGDACCGGAASGGAQAVESASPSEGRSFRVAGLDCAEEVAIPKKALGPRVGGDQHLAFDVLNGRMTVLESAGPVSDDAVIKAMAETGMSAKPWDAGTAGTDQAAHLRRQKI